MPFFFCAFSSFLIIFQTFGSVLVLGLPSTWELYKVFNGTSSSLNNQSSPEMEGSKIPLVFTFKPDDNIKNLTTGRGRVLFVGNKINNTSIPRFISNWNNETLTSTQQPNPNNDQIRSVSLKSETTGFSLSSMISLILQFVTVDDIIELLNKLRKALINYYGLPTTNSKTTSDISTGREGWGGIGFPSLEGALLSLAFLTFAVFLIDLIQNLLANLRVPTTIPATGGTGGGTGGTIQFPLRGKRSARESWMSTLTNSVFSAIEHKL